jgi:hypothetical protein
MDGDKGSPICRMERAASRRFQIKKIPDQEDSRSRRFEIKRRFQIHAAKRRFFEPSRSTLTLILSPLGRGRKPTNLILHFFASFCVLAREKTQIREEKCRTAKKES